MHPTSGWMGIQCAGEFFTSFTCLYESLKGCIGREAQFELCWKRKGIFSAQHQTLLSSSWGQFALGWAVRMSWMNADSGLCLSLCFFFSECRLNSCDLPSRIKDKIGFIFSLLDFVLIVYILKMNTKDWRYIWIIYLLVLKPVYILIFPQKTRFVVVTMCRGTVRSTTVNLVSSICCSPRTLKCNQFKRRLAQWPFFRWAQMMFNVKRVLC